MRKDEFAAINEKQKKGNRLVIIVAVTALCITGILYALKLQAESRYVTLNTKDVKVCTQDAEQEQI